MNAGESARLFADEGEYERRTSNRQVVSEGGKRAVNLEVVHKMVATIRTTVF